MALRSYASIIEGKIPSKEEIRTRIPLSIISSDETPQQLSRIKASLFFVTFTVVAAALCVITNVGISQKQYEIVELRSTLHALSQENESLNTEEQYLQTPQVLNKKAKSLGMVSPKSKGVINLSNGELIQAEITPKIKEDSTSALNLPKKPETQANRAKRAKEAQKLRVNNEIAAERKKLSEVKEIIPVPVKEPQPVVKPVDPNRIVDRPVFAPEELNGGSIPAPKQQIPTL